MGCGSCKHGKVFMPMVSNLDGSLLKDYSPLYSSQGPNDSYVSISKTIAKHHEEFPELSMDPNGYLSPNFGVNSERSRMSQELNTASKEFKKFLIEYSQTNKFLPQREYKIYVWTSSREFLRKLFPERTLNEHIEIEGKIVEVTFSIYTSSAPILIDCVLYLMTKIEDFKEVYNLNQKYKYVWTQALISTVEHQHFEEIANTLGISMFKLPAELYVKICQDDLKLFNLLRGVFNSIDANHSGEIEFAELFHAIQRIQDDITFEDMRDAIARIDINNDGTISFEEFCFWWKKGRQGAVSISEIALNWAKQLTLNVPETKVLLQNITRNRAFIEKKVIKKEISIKVGSVEQIRTEINVDIGKSSVRERLLNDLNTKLSLFSKDIWLSIKLISKNPQTLPLIEKALKQAIEAVLDSFFCDLMDGKKIKKAIKYTMQITNQELLITFVLELADNYLEPLNKLFYTFDDIFTSPLNDSLILQVISSNNFLKMMAGGNLFECLGGAYEIKGSTEYWSKYVSLLMEFWPVNSTLRTIVYSFMLSVGRSDFNFNLAADFKDTIYSIFGMKFEFGNLITPPIIRFLRLLENQFEDSIECYLRVSNLGGKIVVKSKDIFSNLIING